MLLIHRQDWEGLENLMGTVSCLSKASHFMVTKLLEENKLAACKIFFLRGIRATSGQQLMKDIRDHPGAVIYGERLYAPFFTNTQLSPDAPVQVLVCTVAVFVTRQLEHCPKFAYLKPGNSIYNDAYVYRSSLFLRAIYPHFTRMPTQTVIPRQANKYTLASADYLRLEEQYLRAEFLIPQKNLEITIADLTPTYANRYRVCSDVVEPLVPHHTLAMFYDGYDFHGTPDIMQHGQLPLRTP